MKTKRLSTRRLRFEALEGRRLLSASIGLQAAGLPMVSGPKLTTSDNWSGYDIQTKIGAVDAVSGSWTVPKVTGTSLGSPSTSVWVGIDGSNNGTVEQIGTSSQLSNGVASYRAWFEMFPNAPVNITTIGINRSGITTIDPVHPGDAITASVVSTGNTKFTLTIEDVPVTGSPWTYTTVRSNIWALRDSAEWIVEAAFLQLGPCAAGKLR